MSLAFDDPSPDTFEAALAIFTLATLYLYSIHRGSRYQKYSVIAVLVATAVLSVTRHILFLDEPLAHSIRITLPTCITITSTINAIIHWMEPMVSSGEQEPELEQKEKTFIKGQEKCEKQGS